MEKVTIGPRRTNLTNPISRQLYLSYAQYDDGFNVNMLIIYEALALYHFFFPDSLPMIIPFLIIAEKVYHLSKEDELEFAYRP